MNLALASEVHPITNVWRYCDAAFGKKIPTRHQETSLEDMLVQNSAILIDGVESTAKQARKSSEDTHFTRYARFEKFGLGKLWVKKVFENNTFKKYTFRKYTFGKYTFKKYTFK